MEVLPIDSPPPPPTYADSICKFDSPPEYSCHVNLISHFLFKRELDTPSMVAYDRRWRRVEVELCGTVLYVRTHTKGRSKSSERAYTLQAADAGIAIDYSLRSHVLRVRAEGEQFLLATTDMITVVNWVERLNTAIAISLALDDREDPKFRILPIARKPVTPGFQAEFRRKCREEWWQSKAEREWLGQPHRFPEGQSPYLIPAAQQNELALSQRSLSLSIPSNSALQSDEPARQANANPTRITLMVEPGRTGSIGSMVYVRIDSGPYQPSKDGSSSPIPKTNLDYVRGCARTLRYASSWRGGYYIRNGMRIRIRENTTVGYLTKLSN